MATSHTAYDRVPSRRDPDSDSEKEDSDDETIQQQLDETLRDPGTGVIPISAPDPSPAPIVVTPPDGPSKPVAWRDLPRKNQLLVITLARLSEPLVHTSLTAYMFYQLKWFDPSLSDAVIASQAGILHASFTAAQFTTALLWGRLADSPVFGRKMVILCGLGGTCVSAIGFGFSTTFPQALCFRLLGGVTNGNVGVMRTMISEIIRDKKYQSRAFLILPMTFNVGVIIGPILGGLLSDPAGSYPSLFGQVEFFKKYPYAAPNLVSAVFLFTAMSSIWLFLEETLDALHDHGPDLGIRFRLALTAWCRRLLARMRRARSTAGYRPLHTHSRHHSTLSDLDTDTDVELEPDSPLGSHDDDSHGASSPPPPPPPPPAPPRQRPRPRYTARLPFRRLFTRNVLFTFTSHFILALHVGTFNSLWFVFLSTPVSTGPAAPPWRFTGGLGLPPSSIGFAMATLGVIGLALQLLLYPRLSARLGTLRSFRASLPFFPLAYPLAPYLALVPSSSGRAPDSAHAGTGTSGAGPAPKTGPVIWLALAAVLALQVTGRTFALPGQTILVNNCAPHPSVLGTVHGLAQSVSSAARTIGPVLGGWAYGVGLEAGVVGAVWWGLAAFAVLGFVASWFLREGDGHEIWLEGDEED
ncbi:hypothetical protein VD0003_g5750 [Verticillium dahliae]|nr:hypothetical protein VD0003_g5750 [Verticillium dahliae]